MKPSMIVTSVAVAAAAIFAGSQLATGQPDKEKAPAAQPDQEKIMEEWLKLAQPGEEHKMLARMVGTWEANAKFFMEDPATGNVQEIPSKGEATFKSELEGRWIRQDYKGVFAEGPFAGIGFTGYDNSQQKYVATWMDTMSTSMMQMTGTYDPATKTLTMTGSFDMPGMGKLNARHVMTEKDPDTYVFMMFHSGPDGKENKEGEITYTRKK